MDEFVAYFVEGYTQLQAKSRRNSKFFNQQISEKKYLSLHPMIIPQENGKPECIEFLVCYTNENTLVYPLGEDLQHEVFKIAHDAGWHEFINTGLNNEDLECVNETVYIETSRFTPIPVSIPTWQDLLNAPKIGDADFDILQGTFEEYHDIDNDYEATQNLHELFEHCEKKPNALELRVVWEDVDSSEKYGDRTVLVFWKDTFIAVGNDNINRYSHNLTFYVSNVEFWKEMMQELYNHANIPVSKSSLRGAELLDFSNPVENITCVPGFTEKDYNE